MVSTGMDGNYVSALRRTIHVVMTRLLPSLIFACGLDARNTIGVFDPDQPVQALLSKLELLKSKMALLGNSIITS